MDLAKKKFKQTTLRNDILSILRNNKKPMKAYEILNQLKNLRPNAKPPTVYRVLEFLVNMGAIHRINSTHSYSLCQLEIHHCEQHGIDIEMLLICQQCNQVSEFTDSIFTMFIHQFLRQQKFMLQGHSIELAGICQQCVTADSVNLA